MGEFFKGWRRKVGTVSLVLALPLMGMWVRSYMVEDRLAFTIGDLRHAIGSIQGSVVWDRWLDRPRAGGIGWSSTWLDINRSFRPRPAYYIAPPKSALGQVQFESRSAPYWPIVMPLTLISAFLLLIKPRKSIQKELTESTPAEGG